jgi:hypothetical protein
MNRATDRAGEPRYWTLRRHVGGTLATAGIFAVFFGVENLTGSRAVSLTLLIVGLVSVVFGLKLRGRSRSFSGERLHARHVPDRGANSVVERTTADKSKISASRQNEVRERMTSQFPS